MTRPSGVVARVGVPHHEAIPTAQVAFYNKVTVGGGPAWCAPMAELLPDVLAGRLEPVFDRIIYLAEVSDGYRAMNERKAQCDGKDLACKWVSWETETGGVDAWPGLHD